MLFGLRLQKPICFQSVDFIWELGYVRRDSARCKRSLGASAWPTRCPTRFLNSYKSGEKATRLRWMR